MVSKTLLKNASYFLSVLCLSLGSLLGQSKSAPLKLDPAFELHLQFDKPVDVGQIGTGAKRRVVSVRGGTLQGSNLKGKLMPGADYQIIHPDGLTEIDAHYVVQMESGDLLYLNTRGMRHGPPEIMQKLNAGERVDQTKIYFRTIISVETAAPSLQWMARSIFLCWGERLPDEAVLHAFRVN